MGSLADNHQRLRSWVLDTLGDVEMTFGAPSSKVEERPLVFLYALGLEELVYRHGTTGGRAPQGFRFRFLITTGAPSPQKAQELLGELVFTAMDEADFDIELSGSDSCLWQLLGIPPRPAFFLFVSVQRPMEEVVLPKVQEPPRLESSVSVPLVGRVVGPGDIPLMRARVELPTLDQATYTDADGRFRFPAVPKEPAVQEIKIHARGIVRTLALERPADPKEPVLVYFEL